MQKYSVLNKEPSEIEEEEVELNSSFTTTRSHDIPLSRKKNNSQIFDNNNDRALSNHKKIDNLQNGKTIDVKTEIKYKEIDQSFEYKKHKLEKQLDFENENLATEKNKRTSQVLNQKMEEMRTNVSQLEKELDGRYAVNEPILLLNIDESGKILLNKKALTILKSIKTNIACISVVGPYRTGKSFLLNRFLGIF